MSATPFAEATDWLWLHHVTPLLVCGMACKKPMSYSVEDGVVVLGCALGCDRREPVRADDIASMLLRILSQLKCMAGMAASERLARLPGVAERVTVGAHGRAISWRWIQPGITRPRPMLQVDRPSVIELGNLMTGPEACA